MFKCLLLSVCYVLLYLLCCILLIFSPVSIVCAGKPREGLAPYGYVPSILLPYGTPAVFTPKKNWPERSRLIEPRLHTDGVTWLAPPFSVQETGVVTLMDHGELKGHYKIQKDGRTTWTLDRPPAVTLPGFHCSKNLFHSLCIVYEKMVLPFVIFVLTPPRPPPSSSRCTSTHTHRNSHTHTHRMLTLLCSTLTVAWVISWWCTDSRFDQRSRN